ncbi:MAG: sulfatase [Muribaculaceae bacterium]|nr:sulfatase [Muribaculaceae bacterium]
MNSKIWGALACIGGTVASAANHDRPNIILFMVDDMGWQDTSVPFDSVPSYLNSRYDTPNMERLARMGVKMTSAYACSISSPSRCSLMTGMNQARHRVTNWTIERDKSTDEPNPYLDMPDWNYNGIQPAPGVNNSAVATSYVELLRQAGYHTIHIGKAHFGAMNTPSANPLNYGFDVNVAGHAAGGPASYLGEKCFGFNPDGTAWHPRFATPGLQEYWQRDIFLTEALTREAIKALDSAATLQKPFYLNMSHYAVHVPFDKDSRFYDKYRARGLDDTEARYASLVEGMDKSLGDIMDYLEATDRMQNTVIIFMSDNGGLDFGGRGKVDDGRHNSPLRSGKGSVYEGGVREPMIVYWKDNVKPASTISDYIIIEDFFPTILDIAGVSDYSVPQTIDGVSFMGLLRGTAPADSSRLLVWNTPNTWIPVEYEDAGQGYGQTCAIRRGDYKLIYFYRTGRKELYNIKEDMGETTDLSAAMPQLTEELSRLLGNYLRDADAQRPSFKATGLPCPWPDEVI